MGQTWYQVAAGLGAWCGVRKGWQVNQKPQCEKEAGAEAWRAWAVGLRQPGAQFLMQGQGQRVGFPCRVSKGGTNGGGALEGGMLLGEVGQGSLAGIW